MQARRTGNGDVINVLTESQNRINAMALVYTQLYEGGDLSEINMKGFVNRCSRISSGVILFRAPE